MLNRRKMIQGLASLPLVSFCGPIQASAQKPSSRKPKGAYDGQLLLDIFLHGMFAISFRKDGLTLLPPHVEGKTPHVYLAGDMNTLPQTLDQGAYYGFDFEGADDIPQVDPSKHAVVKTSAVGVYRDGSVQPHCSIDLPLPHQFIPLRSVSPKTSGQYLFLDPTGLQQQPATLPLVSLLQYQLVPNTMGCNVTIKYHIYAEAKDCPATSHSTEAFDSLKSLYKGLQTLKINCHLGLDDFKPEPDPPGSGANTRDKAALVDWLGLSCKDIGPDCPGLNSQKGAAKSEQLMVDALGGRFAIHPTACMSLVLIP